MDIPTAQQYVHLAETQLNPVTRHRCVDVQATILGVGSERKRFQCVGFMRPGRRETTEASQDDPYTPFSRDRCVSAAPKRAE